MKVRLQARKKELEALKAKDSKNWLDSMQDELSSIVLQLVDIDEALTVKKSEVNADYVVKPGTENMVHLSIVRGRRFNPVTGKEESEQFTQLFTYSEWLVFKQNFAGLGYTIMSVLHDPFGEAEAFSIN